MTQWQARGGQEGQSWPAITDVGRLVEVLLVGREDGGGGVGDAGTTVQLACLGWLHRCVLW